jgi:hypothetical protein
MTPLKMLGEKPLSPIHKAQIKLSEPEKEAP